MCSPENFLEAGNVTLSHLPPCQVNEMYFRLGLAGHVIGESCLHEHNCEDGVATTTHIVHICGRCCAMVIPSHHQFLRWDTHQEEDYVLV